VLLTFRFVVLQWNGGPNSLHGTTPHEILRRKESSMSVCSNASWETITTSTTTKPVLAKKKKEKLVDKQRAADRRQKWDSQSAIIDASIATGPASAGGGQNGDSNSATTIMTTPKVVVVAPTNFSEMTHGSSLERSSSDQSTGSLLYGKTPHSGSLLGKSSSLLFPTGVDANAEADSEADNLKRRKINLLLDQCESVRFPFNKKKLVLNNMSLTAADLPLQYLVGTSLGNTLHKLSLTGNRLGSVPAKLVQHLPFLKHLDISQCELHQLPDKWNLPQLKRLNVSHNRLRDFPEEVSTDTCQSTLKYWLPVRVSTRSNDIDIVSVCRVFWKACPSCRSSTCTATRLQKLSFLIIRQFCLSWKS
jgi:hypothetical protein